MLIIFICCCIYLFFSFVLYLFTLFFSFFMYFSFSVCLIVCVSLSLGLFDSVSLPLLCPPPLSHLSFFFLSLLCPLPLSRSLSFSMPSPRTIETYINPCSLPVLPTSCDATICTACVAPTTTTSAVSRRNPVASFHKIFRPLKSWQ